MNPSAPVHPHPKDAAMALQHPRSFISLFLGRISAFFCATFIFLLAPVFIGFWVNDAIEVTVRIRMCLLFPDCSSGWVAANAAADLILLVPTLYFGVALGRFLIRAMPPQLSARMQLSVILMTIPLTIVCALSSLLLTFANGSVKTMAPLVGGDPLAVTIFTAPLLIWCVGVIFPLYERRRKPSDFLDRPFILFLRRFSTFSDRAVINLILRQTPLGNPVVFLIATRSYAKDWNPFLVGFAGMKVLHPFRSLPIIIGSPDDGWKQAAQFLIHRAQTIIFDISVGSDAIDTEIEMISQSMCWSKTICLKEKATTVNYKLEQHIRLEGAQIIHYHKSWIRGLPRMILGVLALIFSPVSTLVLIPMLLVSLLTKSPTALILSVLFSILCKVWLYYLFFVRPSIDSEAKTSLRKMLAGELSLPPTGLPD